MTFKGNCRKVSSETPTPVKEEENKDDTKEERNENKNKNADIKDNDFVILDFVGKKGKAQEMQSLYHKQKNMMCKKILNLVYVII